MTALCDSQGSHLRFTQQFPTEVTSWQGLGHLQYLSGFFSGIAVCEASINQNCEGLYLSPCRKDLPKTENKEEPRGESPARILWALEFNHAWKQNHYPLDFLVMEANKFLCFLASARLAGIFLSLANAWALNNKQCVAEGKMTAWGIFPIGNRWYSQIGKFQRIF